MRVCACVRALADTTFTDYGEGAVEAILMSGARDVRALRVVLRVRCVPDQGPASTDYGARLLPDGVGGV